VLNRGNTAGVVLELSGADDVTVSHVALTGGYAGVWLGDNAGVDRFRLEASELYGNAGYGVYVGQDNADALLEGNAVHGNAVGMRLNFSVGAQVVGNEVWGNSGYLDGYYRDYGGIWAWAWYGSARSAEVVGNRVHDNAGNGIEVRGRAWVVGNEVWGHMATDKAGINASRSDSGETPEVRDNAVWGNYYGIWANSAVAQGNRAWGNTWGIYGNSDAQVTDNRVYSNANGVLAASGTQLRGNLIYGNANVGVRFEGHYIYGGGGQLYNNTVYQAVGSAVYVTGGNTQNVRLANNILWVDEIGRAHV
jgi:nitrous oxidase accessory protein NosD